MKVSVEKLPTSEAVLNVDVTWNEIEKASDKAYRKLVKQVDIQGFRRGKAPRTLLERRLGKEYIYQEGLDDLISETYRNALKEYELTPITQPTLDAPVFELSQDYHFSLTIPVVTPAQLGDWRSLHFERDDAMVSSEEVDEELEKLQASQVDWEVVEQPAEYGDRIKADLKLTSGEQQISDLKENTFELTTERHGLFTGMDEHLVGLKAGDTKQFTTTIPADYSNAKLAGQEANYNITVISVEHKNLPPINDDFARKVSDDQFDSIEELSKVISDEILERKKRTQTEELREAVVTAVIDQATFSIHPLLIDEEIHEIEHQFGHMLEQQHLNLDQYLKMTKKTHEEYHEELRPDAEKRVKRQLILEEIAREEDITVTADELEALFNAYEQIGQHLPRTEEQARSLLLSYRREKTLTRLIELTTDPDPNAENELAGEEEESIVGAEAAALASQEFADSVEGTVEHSNAPDPEAATVTSLPDNTKTEIVE